MRYIIKCNIKICNRFENIIPMSNVRRLVELLFPDSQGSRGFFGSDSSKSTKFGSDVAHNILF
jgi:hypothetical protein